MEGRGGGWWRGRGAGGGSNPSPQVRAGKTKLADITATSVKIARARVRSDRVGVVVEAVGFDDDPTRDGRARTMAQIGPATRG